jgi:hypothetical protein
VLADVGPLQLVPQKALARLPTHQGSVDTTPEIGRVGIGASLASLMRVPPATMTVSVEQGMREAPVKGAVARPQVEVVASMADMPWLGVTVASREETA